MPRPSCSPPALLAFPPQPGAPAPLAAGGATGAKAVDPKAARVANREAAGLPPDVEIAQDIRASLPGGCYGAAASPRPPQRRGHTGELQGSRQREWPPCYQRLAGWLCASGITGNLTLETRTSLLSPALGL